MSLTWSVDVPQVAAAYEQRVRSLCDGDFPRALSLEDRLDPHRWSLEWQLAEWLGQAFGLDPQTRLKITLSNVLGLASIRLQDDIADGELETSPHAELAAALYEAALAPYRKQFAPESDFWVGVERQMSAWRIATFGSASTDGRELAHRGAPLKIPALAICLLAGRAQDLAQVDKMIDCALLAMVLYDHLMDWRDDVAGSRPNAFVEAALQRRPMPDASRSVQHEVLVAMLTTDLVAEHFALIRANFESASSLAASLGVTGLAAHIQKLVQEMDQQEQAIMSSHSGLLARTQEVLFRSYPYQAA